MKYSQLKYVIGKNSDLRGGSNINSLKINNNKTELYNKIKKNMVIPYKFENNSSIIIEFSGLYFFDY